MLAQARLHASSTQGRANGWSTCAERCRCWPSWSVTGRWQSWSFATAGYSQATFWELAAWTHPFTWSFQVMPLFFGVGGYVNALSWHSARRQVAPKESPTCRQRGQGRGSLNTRPLSGQADGGMRNVVAPQRVDEQAHGSSPASVLFSPRRMSTGGRTRSKKAEPRSNVEPEAVSGRYLLLPGIETRQPRTISLPLDTKSLRGDFPSPVLSGSGSWGSPVNRKTFWPLSLSAPSPVSQANYYGAPRAHLRPGPKDPDPQPPEGAHQTGISMGPRRAPPGLPESRAWAGAALSGTSDSAAGDTAAPCSP